MVLLVALVIQPLVSWLEGEEGGGVAPLLRLLQLSQRNY